MSVQIEIVSGNGVPLLEVFFMNQKQMETIKHLMLCNSGLDEKWLNARALARAHLVKLEASQGHAVIELHGESPADFIATMENLFGVTARVAVI